VATGFLRSVSCSSIHNVSSRFPIVAIQTDERVLFVSVIYPAHPHMFLCSCHLDINQPIVVGVQLTIYTRGGGTVNKQAKISCSLTFFFHNDEKN
jgi:hypothetical protein